MKTTFAYDHYYNYDELKNNLTYFATHYQDLVDLEVICVTEEKRNVYAITITNKKTGNALTKPAFHVDGNTHAGEITGSMAAMHLCDYLITNYGHDAEVTRMLDTMTIYAVPRVSPDGTETWLTTPYTIRSVNRPHRVVKGGIQEKDLDGDGVIRMMRIPTPFGAWKKDPAKEGSMIARDPGDRDGEFYDIYPEGVMEPYEGDENLKRKKPEWSLDFNRNYPYGWFPEDRQAGAGKYPLSNPETHALADWIIAHPNIGGVSTNHTSGGVILYPPGTKPSEKGNPADIKAFIDIARMCTEEMGYEALNIFDSFIADQENYDSGAFDDWCYQSQGIVAYTLEYWDLAKRAGVPYVFNARKKEDLGTIIRRFNGMMDWIKVNSPEDYADWKEYDHPYFGKVELGGFNYKFTNQNPPTKFLKEVMEQSTHFLMRFAKAMPKLTIGGTACSKIGEGVYKIEAVIGNTGFLPTNICDEAVKMGIAKGVEVKVSGAEVVSGQPCSIIGNLSGYSRTETGTANAYGNISTQANAAQKKKVSWVVKAAAGTVVKITAAQPKAGIAAAEIELN